MKMVYRTQLSLMFAIILGTVISVQPASAQDIRAETLQKIKTLFPQCRQTPPASVPPLGISLSTYSAVLWGDFVHDSKMTVLVMEFSADLPTFRRIIIRTVKNNQWKSLLEVGPNGVSVGGKRELKVFDIDDGILAYSASNSGRIENGKQVWTKPQPLSGISAKHGYLAQMGLDTEKNLQIKGLGLSDAHGKQLSKDFDIIYDAVRHKFKIVSLTAG